MKRKLDQDGLASSAPKLSDVSTSPAGGGVGACPICGIRLSSVSCTEAGLNAHVNACMDLAWASSKSRSLVTHPSCGTSSMTRLRDPKADTKAGVEQPLSPGAALPGADCGLVSGGHGGEGNDAGAAEGPTETVDLSFEHCWGDLEEASPVQPSSSKGSPEAGRRYGGCRKISRGWEEPYGGPSLSSHALSRPWSSSISQW